VYSENNPPHISAFASAKSQIVGLVRNILNRVRIGLTSRKLAIQFEGPYIFEPVSEWVWTTDLKREFGARQFSFQTYSCAGPVSFLNGTNGAHNMGRVAAGESSLSAYRG
jgi:hypothetical protein